MVTRVRLHTVTSIHVSNHFVCVKKTLGAAHFNSKPPPLLVLHAVHTMVVRAVIKTILASNHGQLVNEVDSYGWSPLMVAAAANAANAVEALLKYGCSAQLNVADAKGRNAESVAVAGGRAFFLIRDAANSFRLKGGAAVPDGAAFGNDADSDSDRTLSPGDVESFDPDPDARDRSEEAPPTLPEPEPSTTVQSISQLMKSSTQKNQKKNKKGC